VIAPFSISAESRVISDVLWSTPQCYQKAGFLITTLLATAGSFLFTVRGRISLSLRRILVMSAGRNHGAGSFVIMLRSLDVPLRKPCGPAEGIACVLPRPVVVERSCPAGTQSDRPESPHSKSAPADKLPPNTEERARDLARIFSPLKSPASCAPLPWWEPWSWPKRGTEPMMPIGTIVPELSAALVIGAIGVITLRNGHIFPQVHRVDIQRFVKT